MPKARPKLPSVSDAQLRVLMTVHEACDADTLGRSPTIRQLSLTLGIAKGTVFQYLTALHRHGCIEREPQVARSIRLTGTGYEVISAVNGGDRS